MKHLNNLAVEHLLDRRWSDVIECVEAAFLDSTADMVPKIYLASGNNEGGDFRAMPAALGDFIGLKWIGVFPNNSKNNLVPYVSHCGILIHLCLFDHDLSTAQAKHRQQTYQLLVL